MAKTKTEQKYYKLYEGVRCVLSIIPAKIRRQAKIEAGDYIHFTYDDELDVITLKIRRT